MKNLTCITFLPQTVWPRWRVFTISANFTISVSGPVFKRGGNCNFLHFPFNFQLFSYKIVFVKCPCALRPRRLEPSGCRGISVWHFPSTFVYKVVLSSNPLITLGLSDRSRCGALRILTLLVQPSRPSEHVRSVSLWCGAHFGMARATFSSLLTCQVALAVGRCSSSLVVVRCLVGWSRSQGNLVQRS